MLNLRQFSPVNISTYILYPLFYLFKCYVIQNMASLFSRYPVIHALQDYDLTAFSFLFIFLNNIGFIITWMLCSGAQPFPSKISTAYVDNHSCTNVYYKRSGYQLLIIDKKLGYRKEKKLPYLILLLCTIALYTTYLCMTIYSPPSPAPTK